MQDFGSTPSLLKRPLRGPRRRVSARRKALLGCLGLFVLLVVVLLLSRNDGTTATASPHREKPFLTSPPTRRATGVAPIAPNTTAVPLVPTPAAGGKDGEQKDAEQPWVTARTPAKGSRDFTALVTGHKPGTAWREPTSKAIVALASAGTVALVTPLVTVRHHREDSQRWESLYASNDSYRVPAWAAPADRDSLHHASIFTSLAAFRDHECATTVKDLFAMSIAPHRLYVGISEERKASDTSCLALLGVDGAVSDETRRVLYGDGAPPDIRVELRSLTWSDVVFPRVAIDVDGLMNGSVPVSSSPHPEGIFLHPAYAAERLSCVAGELETLRDRLRLHEDDVRREAGGGTVFREGRGGLQQRPSRALAGCRVTTRVTAPELARGPTFGRYVTSLFFFDQDYFMVVDSHTRFSVHWDMKLMTRIFQLSTPGVLSYYPNGYREGHEREEYGKTDFMLMCTAQVLSNGMPKLGARWKPTGKRPIVQGFAAAGFMFGDAQYVLDTPFDPFLPYMFDGEEVLFSARMWTGGWDLYGPAQSDIFHHYGRDNTPKYFSIIHNNEARQKTLAERRTLYLLRRAHPWIQELVTRGYVTQDGQETLRPLPPVEAPETRLIVTDEVAAATREISVWKSYYGMGTKRTLAQYWEHTELSDNFVKKRDNEQRWMGGDGLCWKGY